ncbi:MAG: LytTR family DNA-binding domain-containing protein [Bacteroidales bacterium]
MSNTRLRTIIVDDEKPACDVLSNYLTEYCPDVEIISVCRSTRSAFKAITDKKPDLVFLDIEMPKENGFDLLRMFQSIEFNVVFITAFSDYAAKAFRISATDFLLKPVKVTELIEAVEKVKRDVGNKSYQNITALLENLDSPVHSIRKLIIPNLKGFTAIRPDDIIACEADGYCTIFHLPGKKKISSSYNLKHYEELLPRGQFMRVHNSFLVNLGHVEGYDSQGEILLAEAIKCPLGASKKQAFLRKIKSLT